MEKEFGSEKEGSYWNADLGRTISFSPSPFSCGEVTEKRFLMGEETWNKETRKEDKDGRKFFRKCYYQAVC